MSYQSETSRKVDATRREIANAIARLIIPPWEDADKVASGEQLKAIWYELIEFMQEQADTHALTLVLGDKFVRTNAARESFKAKMAEAAAEVERKSAARAARKAARV